jgi:hypothetical protein
MRLSSILIIEQLSYGSFFAAMYSTLHMYNTLDVALKATNADANTYSTLPVFSTLV